MVHDSGDDAADTTTVMVRLLLTSWEIRGFDYAGGDTKIQGGGESCQEAIQAQDPLWALVVNLAYFS